MAASLLPGAVSLGYSPGNKLQGGIDGLLEVIVIGGYSELLFGTPGNGLRGLIIILVEGSFFWRGRGQVDSILFQNWMVWR